MAKAASISVCGVLALAACTPTPPIPVEQAMAQCRARVLNPVETRVGIGLSTGGNVDAGISLGIDLPSATSPEKTYYDCVVSKSGVAPTEPLYSEGN